MGVASWSCQGCGKFWLKLWRLYLRFRRGRLSRGGGLACQRPAAVLVGLKEQRLHPVSGLLPACCFTELVQVHLETWNESNAGLYCTQEDPLSLTRLDSCQHPPTHGMRPPPTLQAPPLRPAGLAAPDRLGASAVASTCWWPNPTAAHPVCAAPAPGAATPAGPSARGH